MTHHCPCWTRLAFLASTVLLLACRSSGKGGGGNTGGSPAGTHDTRTVPASVAQANIGVAECDEYIVKVSRCISEHAPADKRKPLSDNLVRTQASWNALAANPGTRPALGQSCQFALQQAKATLHTFSCEW